MSLQKYSRTGALKRLLKSTMPNLAKRFYYPLAPPFSPMMVESLSKSNCRVTLKTNIHVEIILKDLKTYYDTEYHGIIHKNLFNQDRYYWARSNVFKRLYFKDTKEGTKILDYGCGLGQASASLKGVYGHDASKVARAEARKKGLQVFDETSAIPREEFDVVICRHVLEHVPSPLDVLKELHII